MQRPPEKIRFGFYLSAFCLIPAFGFLVIVINGIDMIAEQIIGGYRASSWIETPAFVESLSLKHKKGESDHTWTDVLYKFRFGDKEYKGSLVNWADGADKAEEVAAYERLRVHQQTGTPFPVYVNPENPLESIIEPNTRWGFIAGFALFVCVSYYLLLLSVLMGLINLIHGTRSNLLVWKNPTIPWLHDRHWKKGWMRHGRFTEMIIYLPGAIFLFIFIAASAVLAITEAINGNYAYLPMLIFLGFLPKVMHLGTGPVRRFLERGGARITFDSMPGVIGGKLFATIDLSLKHPPRKQITCKLKCLSDQPDAYAPVIREAGDKMQTAWEQSREFMLQQSKTKGYRYTAKLEFDIPYKAHKSFSGLPECSVETPRCEWTVEIFLKSDAPEEDFVFSVPVYHT